MNAPSLGVKFRIYGGFFVVVALALGLAIFAFWQLGMVQSQVARMGSSSDNNSRSLEAGQHLEVIRRAFLDFKTSADESRLKDATESEAKALQLLKAAQETTASEEIQRTFKSVETGILDLRSKRDALIGLTRLMQEGREKLVKGGEDLSTIMNVFVERARSLDDTSFDQAVSDLAKSLLDVRVINWRFMATRDKAGPDLFTNKTMTTFDAISAIENLPIVVKMKMPTDALRAGLLDYASSFSTVAESMIQSDDLYNREIVPRINDMIGGIRKAQGMLGREFVGAKDKTDSTISEVVNMQKIMGLIVLLLGAGTAFLIGRSIIKPMRGLVAALSQMASGDFSVEIAEARRKDEIGEVGRAVEAIKLKAAETAQKEAEEKAEAEARAAQQRKAEMRRLADQFQAAVGNIVETVSTASTELEAAANTLTQTAETTQQLSGMVASASEQASANVQSVASATEEMTSSVDEISRQVQESSKIASDAVAQAQKTNSSIAELSQAAARIGDVVKLITAIAEQTNLLALNATIEAARAGDAGRGFAVVAQEVKALAAQTAKATEEIGAQISGMQAATEESVSAIKEIGVTITRISEIASTIAAAVEEQGSATVEIARNVHQAAQGTTLVAQNIADVNKGAAETGSASSQVLVSAQSLASESNRLKGEVESFLHTVRAA